MKSEGLLDITPIPPSPKILRFTPNFAAGVLDSHVVVIYDELPGSWDSNVFHPTSYFNGSTRPLSELVARGFFESLDPHGHASFRARVCGHLVGKCPTSSYGAAFTADQTTFGSTVRSMPQVTNSTFEMNHVNDVNFKIRFSGETARHRITTSTVPMQYYPIVNDMYVSSEWTAGTDYLYRVVLF